MHHIDIGGDLPRDPVIFLCGQKLCSISRGACRCCTSVTVQAYARKTAGQLERYLRVVERNLCPGCTNHPKLPLLLLDLAID